MKPAIARAILVALALSSVPAPARACIHGPADFKGSVTERDKLAFVFHDGVNTHLVVRTTLASEAGLPERMAWVIPLPALPSKYEEVPVEIFQQLWKLIPRDPPRRYGAKSDQKKMATKAAAAPAPQILVHEKQVVGSYQIQPIEILSESAGAELNAWLAKNGFGTVPPENQKYYLKTGAVFLALRVDGLKGTASELKPLHIVYPGDTLRLPLKFSTHSGVFNVRLYALTAQAPSRKALQEFGLRVEGRSYAIDSALPRRAPAVAKLVGQRAGYVTEFSGEAFNVQWPVALFKEDPWLSPDGRGPGGEPGGPDSAAVEPAYPLIAFNKRGQAMGARPAVEWVLPMLAALTLLLALWWLYRCVRSLAAASPLRARTAAAWRHTANRMLLLGLALWVVLVTGSVATLMSGLFGSLLEDSAPVLGWGGAVALVIGFLLLLGTLFANKTAPP